MRKFFLYLLAAFMLASCDNLKKKDKTESEDDTEETTKKKRKKALDEDEETTDEEETPKKKKKVSDDTEEDRVVSNDDEASDAQWNAANRKVFMDNCVGTAEKNAGYERANQYCSCMMEQMQRAFPDPNDVSNMTLEQRNRMASKCNNP